MWYGWGIIFTFSYLFVMIHHPSSAWHLRMSNLVTANGRGSLEPPSNPYSRRLLKELTVEKCNSSIRDWIRDNGGVVSGCEVKDAYTGCKGKGWGLVSCKDVKAGELLARVPFKCCLEESETGRKGKKYNNNRITSSQYGMYGANLPLGISGEVTSEIKLALRLLTERIRHRDPQSRVLTSSREGGMNWGPALDALPETIPGCPIFFNHTMVTALQDQTVKEEVRRISSAILRTARGLSHLPGTPEDMFYGVRVDQDAMAWAWAIVASRAITVNGKLMLIPLVDMANHNFEPNVEIVVPLSTTATTSRYDESGGVELRAIKSISNGEPLEIQYGPMTNDGLMVKYGFVDPMNPCDVCIFKFESTTLNAARSIVGIEGEVFGDTSAALTDIKHWTEIAPWHLAKLQELGLAGLGEAFHVNLLCSLGRTSLTPLVDPRLLAALRILYTVNESELKGKNISQLCNEHMYVSMRNEGLVLMTIIGLCAVLLRLFPTSSVSDKIDVACSGVGSPREGTAEQQLELDRGSNSHQQEEYTTTENGMAIDPESAKWIHFWQNLSSTNIPPLPDDDHSRPSSSSTSAYRWEDCDQTSFSKRDQFNVLQFRIGKKNILNNVIKELSAKLLVIHGMIDSKERKIKETKSRKENISRPKLEAPTLDSTIQLGGGNTDGQGSGGDGDGPFWFE